MKLILRALLLWLGLAALVGLVGCDGGYRKKSGQWAHDDTAFTPADPASFQVLDGLFARDARHGYYRGSLIAGSDGASFEVLSRHEARDGVAVYWCDTYRKAQEYWSIQHLRVDRIEGADPASYTVLAGDHARDRRHAYFQGEPFSVRDVASFEPLEGSYARDAQRGYYQRVEIPGSQGASFAVIDERDVDYARDRSTAWHGRVERGEANRPARAAVRKLVDADLAHLRVLGRGYAADGRRVWFQGERVTGVDAASFQVIETLESTEDARDARHAFQRGQRIAAAAAASAPH